MQAIYPGQGYKGGLAPVPKYYSKVYIYNQWSGVGRSCAPNAPIPISYCLSPIAFP